MKYNFCIYVKPSFLLIINCTYRITGKFNFGSFIGTSIAKFVSLCLCVALLFFWGGVPGAVRKRETCYGGCLEWEANGRPGKLFILKGKQLLFIDLLSHLPNPLSQLQITPKLNTMFLSLNVTPKCSAVTNMDTPSYRYCLSFNKQMNVVPKSENLRLSLGSVSQPGPSGSTFVDCPAGSWLSLTS